MLGVCSPIWGMHPHVTLEYSIGELICVMAETKIVFRILNLLCLYIHYNLKKYDIFITAISLSNDFLKLPMLISTCICKHSKTNTVVLKVLICKFQSLLCCVITWDITNEKFGGDHFFSCTYNVWLFHWRVGICKA